MLLYAEVDRLVTQLEVNGYAVKQSGIGAKQTPARAQSTSAPRLLGSQTSSRISQQQSQSLSASAPSQTGNDADAVAQSANSNVMSHAISPARTAPKFVALCVNRGLSAKTFAEVNISRLDKDTRIFRSFRDAYHACRKREPHSLRNWVIKPVNIKYIQFVAEALKRVYPTLTSPDYTICAHADNMANLVQKRGYESHTIEISLTHPPIPPDLFFHLWECPCEISPAIQSMWLDRLPRKLDQSLENLCLRHPTDRGPVLGWGVLVVEGLNKRMVSRITLGVVEIAIVVSTVYSVVSKDVSSGFAIGAVIVACWTVGMTALYFEFVET
jgi:hypothetical protein